VPRRCYPLPGGGFMCTSERSHKCSAPGCTGRATKQCDFPVNRAAGKSRTCDAWLCDRHAVSVGPDLDYCPPHKRYVDDHAER